jgi:glycosyltransferase involved in cell wall biosynthesis
LSDGANVHDFRFLFSLARRKHEVHLVSFFHEELSASLEKNGIIVHHVKLPSMRSSLYGNYIISPLIFKRMVTKLKPDIVHSGWLQSYGFYSAFADYHPILSMPWGSDILLWPKRSRILKEITRFALSRADMITCDCEQVKKEILELVDFPPERIIVFPWGIDLNKFKPSSGDGGIRKKLGWEDKPVVVHTRKLLDLYGVRYVMRAIPEVIKEVPNAMFLMCGSGPLENEMKKTARNYGISSHIYFAGNVANEELPKFLNSADIYVSGSLYDGTSVSLLEAMACGLPVVVTDVPAILEWVQDGKNGSVVPRRDSSTLARNIVELLNDSALRKTFSRENLAIAKKRADWEKNLDILEDIYRELRHLSRPRVNHVNVR